MVRVFNVQAAVGVMCVDASRVGGVMDDLGKALVQARQVSLGDRGTGLHGDGLGPAGPE